MATPLYVLATDENCKPGGKLLCCVPFLQPLASATMLTAHKPKAR